VVLERRRTTRSTAQHWLSGTRRASDTITLRGAYPAIALEVLEYRNEEAWIAAISLDHNLRANLVIGVRSLNLHRRCSLNVGLV